MKLRFTPRAAQDIADIADYILERNPQAALRVRGAILEALQNLALFPKAGREQTMSNVRKLVTRPYAYLVYYTLDETADEVVVLTVRHPSREREHTDG
jgi:plasmid stabilization system protein ParE